MKTLFSASLAGLMLSGAALAQEDWTFIACDIENRVVGGSPSDPWTSRPVFRFNATDFAQFSSSELRWTSLCARDEDTYSFAATCTITPETVNVRRSGPGVEDEHSINRLDGRYTWRHRYDGSADGYDGSGVCEPTDDPTAGQRRF